MQEDVDETASRSVILTISALVAFGLIWSRLHILVLVRASIGQILLLLAIIAIALFLGIDHLVNHTGR